MHHAERDTPRQQLDQAGTPPEEDVSSLLAKLVAVDSKVDLLKINTGQGLDLQSQIIDTAVKVHTRIDE